MLEEEERNANPNGSRVGTASTTYKMNILDMRDGTAKPVSYSDLSQQEKHNVLSDLLVKSAINHALEKQKQVNY